MQLRVSAPYIVLKASYLSVSVYTNSFLSIAVVLLVFLILRNAARFRLLAAIYALASCSQLYYY
jgi:hypothetical protein